LRVELDFIDGLACVHVSVIVVCTACFSLAQPSHFVALRYAHESQVTREWNHRSPLTRYVVAKPPTPSFVPVNL
jgi:hypothetical protein